jgi:hypothetical protein
MGDLARGKRELQSLGGALLELETICVIKFYLFI